MTPALDGTRLIARLEELGATGRDAEGRLMRLAGTEADRAGRDLFCRWLEEAGLEIRVDQIGNIIGLWSPEGATGAPLVMGSHIDSVIDAGIYDGCTGVLAGLSVIEALKAAGTRPARPVAVVAFTNEEGVRFHPDMLGSLVACGDMSVDDARATVGTDGATLGAELARIGYAGEVPPTALKPHAYLELHVEQGPVLEAEGLRLGAVENLQGISWQKITLTGAANHAGTTPMRLRLDAGAAAARIMTHLQEAARGTDGGVATVGTLSLSPGAINVIPARAEMTVDLRHPDAGTLRTLEAGLAELLDEIRAEGFTVTTQSLARFEPVVFDPAIVTAIEAAAGARQLSCRRMTSGAGHDAQMMARIAPTAMIFVPSKGGISHSPLEDTDPADIVAGAEVLLDVARGLIT